MTAMLRGMATVSYWAEDHAAARRWYTELLGLEPYFVRDGYVEFRIGDHEAELGIVDRRYAPPGMPTEPGGAVLYWHVDDLDAALERLQALGAIPHEPPTDRGEGFTTASVVDPFGNVLGVMVNPHYLEMLGARGGAEGVSSGTAAP